LREKVVRMPNHDSEFFEWATALNISEMEILKDKNKRIWLGHFHTKDIMKNADGSLVLVKKHKDQQGHKYSRHDIKNEMMPVPSCPKHIIDQNNLEFYNFIVDEQIHSSTRSKRTRNSTTPHYSLEFFDNNYLSNLHKQSKFYQEEIVPRPDILFITPAPVTRNKPLKETPYESYIGTADLLQELEKAIHIHARTCTGNLRYTSRDYCTQKGLALFTRRRCELESKCLCWGPGGGMFEWASSHINSIGGDSFYTCNINQVASQAMSPVSKSGVEDFLRGMCLRPQGRMKFDYILKKIVWPYIEEKKEQIEKRKFAEMFDDDGVPKPVEISSDVGHNHARGSQGAVGGVTYQDNLVTVYTDTTSPPARKEAAILRNLCDDIIRVKKVDVAIITTDQNTTSRNIIESESRVNAAQPLLRKLKVKNKHDKWHTTKTEGVQ